MLAWLELRVNYFFFATFFAAFFTAFFAGAFLTAFFTAFFAAFLVAKVVPLVIDFLLLEVLLLPTAFFKSDLTAAQSTRLLRGRFQCRFPGGFLSSLLGWPSSQPSSRAFLAAFLAGFLGSLLCCSSSSRAFFAGAFFAGVFFATAFFAAPPSSQPSSQLERSRAALCTEASRSLLQVYIRRLAREAAATIISFLACGSAPAGHRLRLPVGRGLHRRLRSS